MQLLQIKGPLRLERLEGEGMVMKAGSKGSPEAQTGGKVVVRLESLVRTDCLKCSRGLQEEM